LPILSAGSVGINHINFVCTRGREIDRHTYFQLRISYHTDQSYSYVEWTVVGIGPRIYRPLLPNSIIQWAKSPNSLKECVF